MEIEGDRVWFEGVDFDGGDVGIGVGGRENGEAVECGEDWKPTNGVDVFVLRESVDLRGF